MSTRDRLLDLLAARATSGIDDHEMRELERLLQSQDEVDLDLFERAAAEADLALTADDDGEPIPLDLKQKIIAAAARHLPAPAPIPFERRHTRRGGQRGPLAPAFLGWYAAAAILLLALWAPWSGGPERVERPASLPTFAEQRQELIERAGDVVQVAWNPPEIEGYTGVTGDVVWSNARQSGYMRLRGLPANDPAQAQYQLWIVDPTRDERPIDGGVFDVGSGEVIVPIDAKLRVDRPAAFAITLEQPGGVVVSDGPLLVVAPVET